MNENEKKYRRSNSIKGDIKTAFTYINWDISFRVRRKSDQHKRKMMRLGLKKGRIGANYNFKGNQRKPLRKLHYTHEKALRTIYLN